MASNPEVTVRLSAAFALIRDAVRGRLPLWPSVKGATQLALRAAAHRIRP